MRTAIERIITDPSVTIIGPVRRAVEISLQTAAERGVTSARIFDLLIYGTMREHNVKKLATFNGKDFEGLDGIELVSV